MSPKCRAFALLVVLAAGPAVLADEVKGVITGVDPDKKELTVELHSKAARDVSMTFRAAADAKIRVSHREAGFADLKSGEKVRVLYEVRDGKRVALGITAHGPKPSGSAATTAAQDDNAVRGILRRVSVSDREIVVVGPGAKGPMTETTVKVPEGTKITREQKVVSLENLKEEETVSVRAEKRDGKLTAVAINVGKDLPPAPAPAERGGKVRKVIEKVLEKAAPEKPEKP